MVLLSLLVIDYRGRKTSKFADFSRLGPDIQDRRTVASGAGFVELDGPRPFGRRRRASKYDHAR